MPFSKINMNLMLLLIDLLPQAIQMKSVFSPCFKPCIEKNMQSASAAHYSQLP